MNLPAGLIREAGLGDRSDDSVTCAELREILALCVERTALRGRVFCSQRVLSISRRGMTRGDYPGNPLRHERGFLALASSVDGDRFVEADLVFDATGGYAIPNAVGPGGLPAIGERGLNGEMIRDHRALKENLALLGGRRLLVVGHGHSAANAVMMLDGGGVDVVWSVRSGNQRPVNAVANDPLPERARVVDQANDHAQTPPPWLRVRRRSVVRAIERSEGSLRVHFFGGDVEVVDAIAAFTGYRPDASYLGELQIESSPVTEGANRLWRAVSSVTDCLSVPRVRPADLASGEPGFWFVGSRSYGRARTFLLQTGLQHIETILDDAAR